MVDRGVEENNANKGSACEIENEKEVEERNQAEVVRSLTMTEKETGTEAVQKSTEKEKLRDMNKDDANSQANVVKSIEDENDVLLATNDEVAKTKWVMDYFASKHICRDREMFDTLKSDGEFGYFKLRNGGKLKVEGIGSVKMKLHDVAIRTFSNMRFVPSTVVNMISMGEMTSQGYKYVGSKWDARCTRRDT